MGQSDIQLSIYPSAPATTIKCKRVGEREKKRANKALFPIRSLISYSSMGECYPRYPARYVVTLLASINASQREPIIWLYCAVTRACWSSRTITLK